MVKKILTCVLLLGVGYPLSAAADDSLVKFKGGIGVIPVSSGVAVAPTPGTALTVESVNRNIVRGVQPPGQIWVIADLKADVKADGIGSIKVRGKGLLLGGGNNIGFNANQSVRATLLCANDGNVLHDSGLVPLEANGDFRIDDKLSPVPPNPCDNAVLLIRNPAGAWFAAGIPKLENDD
jgi:hypothetical protein